MTDWLWVGIAIAIVVITLAALIYTRCRPPLHPRLSVAELAWQDDWDLHPEPSTRNGPELSS
jgi:hypothetical protein